MKNEYKLNKKICSFKLKVLGNFFKLKYKKKKCLLKFNLCLAHKVYLLKKKKAYLQIYKIKKNKILFLNRGPLKIFKTATNIKQLITLRPQSAYTKKGFKLVTKSYKQKTGKKTSYT